MLIWPFISGGVICLATVLYSLCPNEFKDKKERDLSKSWSLGLLSPSQVNWRNRVREVKSSVFSHG